MTITALRPTHAAKPPSPIDSPGTTRATRLPGTTNKNARKAALASFLGSLLEYYDFFIYGSASALVFGAVFFPAGDPALATVLSLATFGIAYVARPLGAVIFGHFGDRVGRRAALIATLLMMGASSFAIGVLPTYTSVGVIAPILLVLCRLLQGVSAGGEAAGASTLSLEYAPEGRRGFFTSFTMAGFAAGMVLATIVFIPVAALPREDLLAWGWRIPFLLSTVVVLVAYLIRRRLEETPVFNEVEQEAEVSSMPLVTLVRTQWRDLVRVIACSLFAVFQSIFAVFGLAYATSDGVGIDRAAMLWVSVLANVIAIGAIPAWAALSDRIGRRPVWLIGSLGSAVLVVVYLWAISTGSLPLVFVTGLLFAGVVYSAVNGLWPSFFTEMFNAKVRFSGFAIGTQFGFLIAGFAPSIGFAIMSDGVAGWVPVAIFAAACGVISAVAAFTARETHRTPVRELGVR